VQSFGNSNRPARPARRSERRMHLGIRAHALNVLTAVLVIVD
jgi:hypothetical protein